MIFRFQSRWICLLEENCIHNCYLNYLGIIKIILKLKSKEKDKSNHREGEKVVSNHIGLNHGLSSESFYHPVLNSLLNAVPEIHFHLLPTMMTTPSWSTLSLPGCFWCFVCRHCPIVEWWSLFGFITTSLQECVQQRLKGL